MMKRIVNGIFYLIIIFISLYILIELFVPERTLDLFGYKPYVVVSSSMEPDINVQDMVIIKDVPEDALSIHDVITFNVYLPELGEEAVVTHYIGDIQIRDDGTKVYLTQGARSDAGEYDEWTNESGEPIEITYDDINGEVSFTIPYIGHFIRLFRNPFMLFLISLNIGIIYIIYKLLKTPSKKTS